MIPTQTNLPRTTIRLALTSNDRMDKYTRAFLSDCGYTVNKINPRQYIARINEMPHLEVWFQRSADVVRKVRDGDVDFGIVGYDTVAEYRGTTDNVVIIHNEMGYGDCYLAIAVPEAWEQVNTMKELADLASKRAETRPLRVVSKFQQQAKQFLDSHNIAPYHMLRADGALEAAPQMGTADFIVDLVSSGVTLRENRLKQLKDGKILDSQAVFIGNRTALTQRPEVLEVAHDMLERFEAHLQAVGHYQVVANIRGESPEAVAQKVFSQPDLRGLQGPTISPVYLQEKDDTNWYAISIVTHEHHLTPAMRQLRQIGGSGVLVVPIKYIFEEEPWRWRSLLNDLGIETYTLPSDQVNGTEEN